MLAISVDRLLATLKNMEYHRIVTAFRARMISLAVFIYVGIWSSLPFAFQATSYSNFTETSENFESCKYTPTDSWTLVMLIAHALVPYMISVICHVIILKSISKKLMYAGSNVDVHHENEEEEHSVTNAVENHVAMATLKISITYGLLWGPSIIYYSLIAVCKEQCFANGYFHSNTEQIMGFFVKLLIFADGVAAPLIYCINHREFKKSAQTLLLPTYGAITNGWQSDALLSIFRLKKSKTFGSAEPMLK